MKLKAKKAFITGGSKGIGKGIAKSFLIEGCKVIICARNLKDLMDTKNELNEFGDIDYINSDISDYQDVLRISEILQKKFNCLDILVNNASILGVKTKVSEYPVEIWDKVFKININGQFYVIKALLPLLIKSKKASIINISSTVGRKGRATWGAYSASKFALEGLTQVLADEFKGTNVRINSVDPGGTRTDMRASAYPDEDPNTLPTPEHISPIFIYLASDESIGINGKEFNARDYIRTQ
ncbi:MAG: SDR family NAD(P)-dependent oxidoreductase [Thermodesulfobacteriota bacterium]